jgi:hypothetical protein
MDGDDGDKVCVLGMDDVDDVLYIDILTIHSFDQVLRINLDFEDKEPSRYVSNRVRNHVRADGLELSAETRDSIAQEVVDKLRESSR